MSEAVGDELSVHVLDRLGGHVPQRRRERQLRCFVLPVYITCRHGRRSHSEESRVVAELKRACSLSRFGNHPFPVLVDSVSPQRGRYTRYCSEFSFCIETLVLLLGGRHVT